MEYELRCIHDGRRSFYGKAVVIEEDGVKKLRSYSTIVCVIENHQPKVFGMYSNTTLRHIKEFLKQNGFSAESWKQIWKDYASEKEYKDDSLNSMFKTTMMIASLGDLFCDNQKDRNDWKARMLKAGLSNSGLIMPDDWDSLSGDEKEERLNKVIQLAKETKQ